MRMAAAPCHLKDFEFTSGFFVRSMACCGSEGRTAEVHDVKRRDAPSDWLERN
jgi:hypothetical protein